MPTNRMNTPRMQTVPTKRPTKLVPMEHTKLTLLVKMLQMTKPMLY